MTHREIPKHFRSIQQRFPEAAAALDQLGQRLRDNGPLDARTSHLVQLAAAAAVGSEGAGHSHARRALAAGATADDLYHVALLLVTTVGFPRAAALIAWVDDVVGDEE